MGSVVQPAKGSRTKFSEEDDRVLWLWVTQHPQKGGGTFGNEIYKQLEAKVMRGSFVPVFDWSYLTSIYRTLDILGNRGEIVGLSTSRIHHVQLLFLTTPYHRPL